MRWILVMAILVPSFVLAGSGEEEFLAAGRHLQEGDAPKAIEIYRMLASEGTESASLYWNWSQAAASRGDIGESLWALLRARRLDPADSSIERELEKLRELANLDVAEISPDPRAELAVQARRFRVDLCFLFLAIVSLFGHAMSRFLRASRWPVPTAWTSAVLAVLVGVGLFVSSLAHPQAVVARRGVPLMDAASPQATILGPLREGEVLIVLGESDGHLRVQDSSGARGWALAEEVWSLEAPPPPAI